jgi:hypothetical protein
MMEAGRFYRGGPSLKARVDEVRIDRLTKKLKNSRGISVYDRPDHHNLTSHGGPYLLGDLPVQLRIVQVGQDPSHHEVVPVEPLALTFDEYQALLDQVESSPVGSSNQGAQ